MIPAESPRPATAPLLSAGIITVILSDTQMSPSPRSLKDHRLLGNGVWGDSSYIVAGRLSLSAHICRQSTLESFALEGNPPEPRQTFTRFRFGSFTCSLIGVHTTAHNIVLQSHVIKHPHTSRQKNMQQRSAESRTEWGSVYVPGGCINNMTALSMPGLQHRH